MLKGKKAIRLTVSKTSYHFLPEVDGEKCRGVRSPLVIVVVVVWWSGNHCWQENTLGKQASYKLQ